MMEILALPSALAFTMNVTLCLIVLSSNPKNTANRLFACFVLAFATWNVGEFVMINSQTPESAIFGVKVVFAGITFIPVFFLHFSSVFPLRHHSYIPRKTLLFVYLIPVAVLACFYWFFRIDIHRLQEFRNVFYYGLQFRRPMIFETFFSVIVLLSAGYITWGIRNLLRSLHRTRLTQQKLQIQYLIFGMVSMAIAGAAINGLNYLFKLNWPVFFLASLYSILVSVFFAFALIKYRLLDIHILIRGGIVYSFLSGLILAVYVLLIKNIGEMISQTYTTRSLLVESGLIVALVYLLRPFQRKAEDLVDRFFYMERFRYRMRLLGFSRDIVDLVEMEGLLDMICNFILQTFHVDRICVVLRDRETGEYRTARLRNVECSRDLAWSEDLVERITAGGKSRELEEYLTDDDEQLNSRIEELVERGFEVAVPLVTKQGALGVTLLGKKLSRKDFTHEELEFLDGFAIQISLAISRGLIYQDMVLKDRQIMQSEKLASLGQLAAGIAHEIRNPLGIISGSAETLLKQSDPETRLEMARYIMEESDRINSMISNFLDFARPKEPVLRRCDLGDLLSRTLNLITPQANRAKVDILREIPADPLLVWIDPEQIQQALLNVTLNALEAMPDGGVYRVTLSRDGKDGVVIRLSDTGSGIPQERVSRIFDPFFTTKDGGTGLGLSIAHTIVEKHGGTISVSTGPDRGTTFVVSLPYGGEGHHGAEADSHR
ncbi:MAG: GAF domain-containing protein [Deltaproteobacteria bacterium]|nr:GAF domain-containing protein [Deltaproteobacteria bacterium]MBW2120841.1 GAF domain-containing protein [Deltaproteobacteria bacterium]